MSYEGASQVTLSSLTTYRHAGRTCHVVDVPDAVLDTRDPRNMLGEVVRLDGIPRRVDGVEAYAVPWYPGCRVLRRVALVVSDPSDVDLGHLRSRS